MADFPAFIASKFETITKIFLHWLQQVYRIAIINKTPLHNGNCPITDPIAKMGVAHNIGCLREG